MLLSPATLCAQSTVTITVEDSRGATLPSATVVDPAGKLLGQEDQAYREKRPVVWQLTVAPESEKARSARASRIEAPFLLSVAL